jgi:site-specific recombinase XerD
MASSTCPGCQEEFRKFRSTFLTRLLQSGCDIANVQALAGHLRVTKFN